MARRFALVPLVLALAIAGCTSGDADTTASSETSGTTTSDAEPQDPVELPGPGEPWDLLFIRNSGWLSDLVPETYARLAAEALGVEVRVHEAGLDPRLAWKVLEQLKDDTHPPLGAIAREAEIIVVQADPEQSGPGNSPTIIDHEFDQCFLYPAPAERRAPVLPTDQEWQAYRDLLDAIYAEIWSLREGAPTVLVAIDFHNPAIGVFQREQGVDVACSDLFRALSDVTRDAATAHGAVMVSIFELLNGPNGDVDPREMGYTGGPTIKPPLTNEVGARMVAEALATAGFEPVTQP